MNNNESILQTSDFYVFIGNNVIFIEPKDPPHGISLADVAREISRCIIQMENDQTTLGE